MLIKIYILFASLVLSTVITSSLLSAAESDESEVLVRAQTLQEEFDTLIFQLGVMRDFKVYRNIKNQVSHIPLRKLANSNAHITAIEKMISDDIYPEPDDTIIHDITLGEIRHIFNTEEYSQKDFSKGVEILNNEKYIVNRAVKRLLLIKEDWDFRIYPKYEIVLTKYGPGGSYNMTNGKVILLLSGIVNGAQKSIYSRIIHELVHLGIEESIVVRYKLTQSEKERVVDYICKYYFEDLLPKYSMQRIGARRMDKFINAESIRNLPMAIENYVKKYPRKD